MVVNINKKYVIGIERPQHSTIYVWISDSLGKGGNGEIFRPAFMPKDAKHLDSFEVAKAFVQQLVDAKAPNGTPFGDDAYAFRCMALQYEPFMEDITKPVRDSVTGAVKLVSKREVADFEPPNAEYLKIGGCKIFIREICGGVSKLVLEKPYEF